MESRLCHLLVGFHAVVSDLSDAMIAGFGEPAEFSNALKT